jgi:hypothetical protein
MTTTLKARPEEGAGAHYRRRPAPGNGEAVADVLGILEQADAGSFPVRTPVPDRAADGEFDRIPLAMHHGTSARENAAAHRSGSLLSTDPLRVEVTQLGPSPAEGGGQVRDPQL